MPLVGMAAKLVGIADYFVSRLLGGARVVDRDRYARLSALEKAEARQRDLEDEIDLQSIRAGRAEIAEKGAVDWEQLKAEAV